MLKTRVLPAVNTSLITGRSAGPGTPVCACICVVRSETHSLFKKRAISRPPVLWSEFPCRDCAESQSCLLKTKSCSGRLLSTKTGTVWGAVPGSGQRSRGVAQSGGCFHVPRAQMETPGKVKCFRCFSQINAGLSGASKVRQAHFQKIHHLC